MTIWSYIVTHAWTVRIKSATAHRFIFPYRKVIGIALIALFLDMNKPVRLFVLFAARRAALWGLQIFSIWLIDKIPMLNLYGWLTLWKKKWSILMDLMTEIRGMWIIYKLLNINNYTGGFIYHVLDGFYLMWTILLSSSLNSLDSFNY